jgi:hypothetical protein
MGLLVYPMIQGRQANWPTWTYAMITAGIASFALLVLWSRRTASDGRDPLIEPGLLTRRQYTTGLCSILVFYTGMLGTLLAVTLFLQLGEHFSAIHAGLTIASFALGIAAGAALSAALLAPRFGRTVLQLGTVLFAVGLWWLHATIRAHGLHTSTQQLAAPQLVAGLGMGMLVGPLFDFILAAVSGDEVGSASGVLNAVQQLAGALGVATIGTLFFATLAHDGYVLALEHALIATLITTPALLLLLSTLPRHARDTHQTGQSSTPVPLPTPLTIQKGRDVDQHHAA